MGFEHILVERSGDFATVTMNRPQRRNALSLAHMRELIAAFRELGDSDALGHRAGRQRPGVQRRARLRRRRRRGPAGRPLAAR